MEKITKIEKAILKSRLEKDDLTKNLLQTLKGEYQNAIKNGESESDLLIEKLAKKMVKNAELIGTEDSKKEIEILKEYLPVELSESALRDLIINIVKNSPDKTETYKSGNKGVIGWFMGTIVKESNGSADAKLAGKLLNEVLQNS